MSVPQIKLNDGHSIPQLGFGTWQVKAEDAASFVSSALKIGYRHVDTAQMYKNEKEVGEGIKASGVAREEVYITTKLNNTFHEPDKARKSFDESLKALGVDYVDLFLIHWPLPTLYGGDYVSTWNTLIEFKKSGRARSVGVSNFQIDHLKRLAAETELVPACNQIEAHPFFNNDAVRKYGVEHGIHTEAWSPIGQGKVLQDPQIQELAQKVGKSPAQVALRWHIQRGDIIFPKSSSPERMKENFELFDFELSAEDMATISKLDKGAAGRIGPDPDTFAFLPQ